MAIKTGQPGSLPHQFLQSWISHSRQAKLLALFFFLIIALPHQSRAQQTDVVLEDIPVGGGIPTTVKNILQDRTGYLWFATWSGLYKYDGYNIVSYKHYFDDSTSLFDNNLNVLYEDNTGILWIGSRVGLERFDPKLETFTHFTPNPSRTGDGRSNQIWAICEDRHGVLWVGSDNGLYKFDRSTDEFTALHHDSTDPGSIAHNTVYAIYEDKQGLLWFGTRAGVDTLDYQAGGFRHSAPGYLVQSFVEDGAGILWLGAWEALLEYNPKQGTFSKHRLNPNRPADYIIHISLDVVTGSLWIGTHFGLFSFDRRTTIPLSYSIDWTPAVHSERSGTLWVGTTTGIRKLNRVMQPFTYYHTKDLVVAVKRGKEGIVWPFTPGLQWKQFDYYREQFLSISPAGDHLLFVYNSGADLLFRSKNKTAYLVDSLNTIQSWGYISDEFLNSVTASWKGSKGYWTGTQFGVLLLNNLKTNSSTPIGNCGASIDYIFEDSDNLLWIATSTGKVYCYRQEGDSSVALISAIKNPVSLHGRTVNEITEDTRGRILFATTGGLEIYDRTTDTISHFAEKAGLPSDDIRGIVEDNHGFLWINTPNGIAKFDPDTKQLKNYDASYGLRYTADIMLGKGCKTSNGGIFFPSAKGFTRFHPDSVKDNPFIPPIVITAFKKFDKPSPFSSEMHLPYDENFLSFEFAALSYISPERNQYAYMMEGLDKDWVYCGTRRYASYPGLDPGEYVFRVKGSNNDGVWNEAGTSISLVIFPPWWRTTWAYLLYAAILLSMVYLTWKMQVKRIRMAHEFEMSRFEAEKLHEVDAMKSRFFADISHEFRTPLTLILGPVKHIIGLMEDPIIRNDLRVVHRNASRLLGLVNQLLDISRLESGTMKLQTEDQNIIPLLKGLVLSFASYAERKRIALTFSSTADAISAYVDRDKVEKIITNILSNAFKFTPEGGRIEVAITRDKACANITIRDTGIGIPREKIGKIFDRFYQVDGSHTREHEGTGIGLSLTKELVELHKGTIQVESTEGKGTSFTVRIRLGRDHLKPEEICEPRADEQEAGRTGKEAALVEEVITSDEEISRQGAEIGLPAEAKKPLLLIVEDNTDVRHYIRNSVVHEYRILEAIDGHDGWTKSIEHVPDIIVSDVMMPRMDGFQLCEKLKTDERTSHIPVVLLTAKASTQDKIEGFHTGADDYIMKPFEPEELNARMKNLIAQRKRIHEYFRRHGLVEIESKNITPVDQKFLQRVAEIVSEHISDACFGVESLAAAMAVSRSVLFKKIEALVGEPPSELIKRSRLNRAADLIERKCGNISEIALEVGFNNPSYFAESFKRQFGCTPSQYHRAPTIH
jgi:signal transduction histidine kinase/ligand-binding sensor domain-containing protein/AraC-like DNA-binding protein